MVTCEESSSYLLKVLTKIQRERLGLLDDQLGTNYNDVTDDDSNDYIYVNDADEASSMNNFYQSESDNSHDSTKGEETKNSHMLAHSKPGSSLPTDDLIYIYNDTIYLYKAPNSSVSLKHPIHQMQMFHPPDGKPHKGFIPNKMKLMHSSSDKHKDAVHNTNPDNLINMVITGDDEGDEMTKPPETSDGDEEEVEGYYYEYYPLDQIPPEFADTISMLAKPTKPIKPGMVTKPKKPMIPVKMVMKKKRKQPVGPLFKAMAVFVGTAVVFIVSILLLPRVKLVKAKSSSFDFNELPGQTSLLAQELWS
ncbi:hypothetical protein GE061_000596 [Apolygus lucorum]|uniref:Uncharacterized protein n=1 Tax=Apolygus lucorum TaxID=248454 RepID=A0A8S9Y7F6_APOLU|nr:hypothetical protein GE061_000596 [Apolygus lucorum]